jgi:hypothetical protein
MVAGGSAHIGGMAGADPSHDGPRCTCVSGGSHAAKTAQSLRYLVLGRADCEGEEIRDCDRAECRLARIEHLRDRHCFRNRNGSDDKCLDDGSAAISQTAALVCRVFRLTTLARASMRRMRPMVGLLARTRRLHARGLGCRGAIVGKGPAQCCNTEPGRHRQREHPRFQPASHNGE